MFDAVRVRGLPGSSDSDSPSSVDTRSTVGHRPRELLAQCGDARSLLGDRSLQRVSLSRKLFEVAAGLLARVLMVFGQRTRFLVFAGTLRELLRDVIPVPLRLFEPFLEIANPLFRALQRFSIGRKCSRSRRVCSLAR